MDFLAVSPVSLTDLCSFWYSLKDLFSLHKLVDKAVPDRGDKAGRIWPDSNQRVNTTT